MAWHGRHSDDELVTFTLQTCVGLKRSTSTWKVIFAVSRGRNFAVLSSATNKATEFRMENLTWREVIFLWFLHWQFGSHQ